MCGLQESFEHNFSPNLESHKTSQSENFRFRSVLREQHFPWLVCQRRAIAAGSPPFLPEWFGSHSYQASNANKPSREEAAGSSGLRRNPGLTRLEQLQTHKISVASIFEIVTGIGWNEGDIVCFEVHGASGSDGHKHGHASLPRKVELPLRGIRMPMELAETSWLDDVQSSSNIPCGRKVVRVDDAHFAPTSSLGRRHRFHLEGVLDGRLHSLPANCCLVLRQ